MLLAGNEVATPETDHSKGSQNQGRKTTGWKSETHW